jgi:hypothetical protein
VERTIASAGKPLDTGVRDFAESRLGHALDGVRIHDDAQAARSASDVEAQAYTAGNHIAFADGKYDPESPGGRSLILHELAHVVQQGAAAPLTVQRKVRETVIENPLPGAQACVAHLHGDEENARQVALGLRSTHCVNLVDIKNKDRNLHIDLPSGDTCLADPNRIFTSAGIKSQALVGKCADEKAARAELLSWRDSTLIPALSKCRGGSGKDLTGPLPITVMHNNSGLTIKNYLPGGSEAGATETDKTRLGGAKNPTIIPTESDESYFLTTSTTDFKALRGTRNTVLQSTTPTDDGSLSVALASDRYVNVETFGKTFKSAKDPLFVTDQAMALEVMAAFGAGKQPCPVPQTSEEKREVIQRRPEDETGEDDGVRDFVYELERLIERIERFLRDTFTKPSAMARESTPIKPFANCQLFTDQTDLDAQKAKWAGVIGAMPVADVISWVIGITQPPASVAKEVDRQIKCLTAAVKTAGGTHGFSVPKTGTVSEHRSFADQERIWTQKFNFTFSKPFDRISDAARTLCGSLLSASDTKWDPKNSDHATCWKSLSADQKQEEILQASSAPGISRHHFGSDVDLFDPALDPAQWKSGAPLADVYAWMRTNASTYGFIQSFTAFSALKGGYMEERWHWSYYPVAQALLEFAKSNMTAIETELLAHWGTRPEFSYIRANWRKFVFRVNESGTF